VINRYSANNFPVMFIIHMTAMHGENENRKNVNHL